MFAKHQKYFIIGGVVQGTNCLMDITYKSSSAMINDILGYYDEEAIINYAIKNKTSLANARIFLRQSLLPIVDDLLMEIRKDYKTYYHQPVPSIYQGATVIVKDITVDTFAIHCIEQIKRYATVIDDCEKKEFILKEYENVNGEVESLAIAVTRLLSNVEPKHIFVHLLNEEYYPSINQYFHFYDIAYQLDLRIPLISVFNPQKWVVNTNNTFDALTMITTQTEGHIYSSLLGDVLSKYASLLVDFDLLLPLIEEELRTTYIPKNANIQGIHIGDMYGRSFSKDDYLFIVGAADGLFPNVHRDQEYFSDERKEKHHLPTSHVLNNEEIKRVFRFLKNDTNINISYAKSSLNSLYRPTELFPIETANVAKAGTKKALNYRYAQQLDKYYKYCFTSDTLEELAFVADKNEYGKYRHHCNATKISPDFKLSYTSIQKYNRCAFYYFIENCLGLYRKTDTKRLVMGSLFHECLAKCSIEPIDNYLSKTEISKSTRYYLQRYKQYVGKVIDLNRNSDYSITARELSLSLMLRNHQLSGKIDCVLEHNGYYVVIDYKTGNANYNLDFMPYGIDLQIPIYFMLLNKKIAGGYLMPVLPTNPFLYNQKKSYQEQMDDYFKLSGYTLDAQLPFIDCGYHDKSFISGIRVKNDGNTLYETSLSHVVTEEEMEKIIELAYQVIDRTIMDIENAKFPINPKVMNKISVCQFCEYNDLCFKKPADDIELKGYNGLSFIRGVKDDDAEETE